MKHLVLAIKSETLLLISTHRYRISMYAKSHYSAVYSFVRHRAHDRQTDRQLKSWHTQRVTHHGDNFT